MVRRVSATRIQKPDARSHQQLNRIAILNSKLPYRGAEGTLTDYMAPLEYSLRLMSPFRAKRVSAVLDN
jgi:hypothetical protein